MPTGTVLELAARIRALIRSPLTQTVPNWTTEDLVFFVQQAIRKAERELSKLDVNYNVNAGNVSLVAGTHTYSWPASDDTFRAVLMVEYNFGGRVYPIFMLEGGWRGVAAFSQPNPASDVGVGGYHYLPFQVGATAKFRLFPTPQESSANALLVTYEKSVIPNAGYNVAGGDAIDLPTEWKEYAFWQAAGYAIPQDEESPTTYFGIAAEMLKELKESYSYRAKGTAQPRQVILEDF